jgi:hypothetical protein
VLRSKLSRIGLLIALAGPMPILDFAGNQSVRPLLVTRQV